MDKWCCFCFQDKPEESFDKQPKDRLFHACRDCMVSLTTDKSKKKKSSYELRYKLRPRIYLYVIQSVVGGPIKIGVSKNVAKRIVSLQTASPVKLTAIRIFDKIPTIIEEKLHYKLVDYRSHGEWFKEEALPLVDIYMERTIKAVAKALGVRVDEIK